MQNTVRLALFGVFFAIGATVVCLAALCDDLVQYYIAKQRLAAARQRVYLLERLNADYEALLDLVQQDPNMIKRTAPATLGTWPQEPNTAYPAVRLEELLAARQTMFVAEQPKEEPPIVPEWLAGCSRPGRRWGLFLSGAGLVVVAFICFGPQGQTPKSAVGCLSRLGPDSSVEPERDGPQDGPTSGLAVLPKEEPQG